MLTVRARVQNGRLVVDEPTSLPEGTEVELVGDDDMPTEDELAELRRRARDDEARIAAPHVFAKMRRT